MVQLLKVMGIPRGSFYAAFESKQNLFVKALEHYKQTILLPRLEKLQHPTSALKGIEEFIDSWIAPFQRNEKNCGCLITNTSLEMGLIDNEVEEMVKNAHRLVENRLTQSLKRAKNSGEILDSLSPEKTARYVFSLCNGINVLGKISSQRKYLKSFKHMAMTSLTRNPGVELYA